MNAHPHTDTRATSRSSNGIIDNAAALRQQLTADGVDLVSDTDTGARPPGRPAGADTLEGKVRDALAVIEGTYGIASCTPTSPTASWWPATAAR